MVSVLAKTNRDKGVSCSTSCDRDVRLEMNRSTLYTWFKDLTGSDRLYICLTLIAEHHCSCVSLLTNNDSRASLPVQIISQ
jgi:hypothetical protein